MTKFDDYVRACELQAEHELEYMADTLAASEERCRELREDSVRLDRIEELGTYSRLPDRGWMLRRSTSGRGLRLYETSIFDNQPTIRRAIDKFFDEIDAARAAEPDTEGGG